MKMLIMEIENRDAAFWIIKGLTYVTENLK
jgi:hypothetical protein